MKKKLNLVLRDPVKLHKTNQNIPELPSPYEKREEKDTSIEETEKILVEKNNQSEELEVKVSEKKEEKKPKKVEKKEEVRKIEIEDIRKELPLRIRQTWEYFCKKANQDNELRNSFIVTRAEVMREAGIGSTNTYRDALKRIQTLGLITIELRPGVTAGSVFYLTEKGLEQAELVLSEN